MKIEDGVENRKKKEIERMTSTSVKQGPSCVGTKENKLVWRSDRDKEHKNALMWACALWCERPVCFFK